MDKKLKITLVRFPKCASSFLHRNFSALLKEGKISDYRSETEYRRFHQGRWLNTPEDSEVGEWQFISCIRHPVERFFSALFFGEAMLYSDRGCSRTPWEELSLEAKIRSFIESGTLEAKSVHELVSAAPGCYVKHASLLTSMDILIFQDYMQEGLDKIKEKWNLNITNKIYGGESVVAYRNAFNKDCTSEKQLLKQKYYGPLEQIFQKDIETYYFLKNKFS